MLICITGAGYVSKKAAEDLIRDFISIPDPGPVTFMLPSYMTTDGLRNVRDVVKGMDHVIVSYKRSVMPEMFRTYQDSHKVVFVLDADSDRQFLIDSDVRELAYDLSRGLYPVSRALEQSTAPQMALDGSESDAAGFSGEVRYDYLGETLSASDLLTELSTDEDIIRANWLRYFDKCTLEELKGLEEEVRHAVHVREKNMHPVYTQYENGLKVPVTDGDSAVAAVVHAKEEFRSSAMEEHGQDLVTVTEPMICNVNDSTRYWKSKAGKYRKAGKSKSRPGETEIWLTQEEIDKL